MKVVYTAQAYESLKNIVHFLLKEQEWTPDKLRKLRTKLLNKADSLLTTHNYYQKEEYLEHLKKGLNE